MSTYDKELLTKIVRESTTLGEVLKLFKKRTAGGNYRILQKYIKLYELDTSHFCPLDAMMAASHRRAKKLEEILVENSGYSRKSLKIRLYKEGLKTKYCELCGQGEEWMGKRLSLILDHINGIYNDNRLQNLRIVCPNCNATFDTHCGKNKQKRFL